LSRKASMTGSPQPNRAIGDYVMDAPNKEFALAGRLDELKAQGRLVLRGHHRPILVIYDHGRVFALDNRCMGFPLERGSVEDGILTCHWHHARFDLESGCTFDLWADDAPIFPVELRNGEVWVRTTVSHPDPAAHWRQRLTDGLGHDLGLVIAKAVHGQLAADVPAADIVRQVALFGAQNRDGWGVGLTILTALANLLPMLPEEEVYLALFHGARRVGADCDGQAPRRERAPLGSHPDSGTLKRWLCRWTTVRHREAAERTLLTAIEGGLSPAVLADALLAGATKRAFADTGHSLDFVNKAFECLDLIGWDHGSAVLPTIVGQMVEARGAEESTAWRQPGDLVALCDKAESELPDLLRAGPGTDSWSEHVALARELLGDDPERSSTHSRRRSAQAPLLPTSADRSLTRQRSESRGSVMPTSTPTGRRRTTSSPMPTRWIRCSGASGRIGTLTRRQCVAFSTVQWRSISRAISMCPPLASRETTASS
jgi:nitrite reductase/ring-hydroxylating ferredoxin subunit